MNEFVFKRLDAIKCDKCIRIDLKEIFCDNELCYAYDKETNLSYYFDGIGHLNLYGSYKLFKPMETYILKALDMIK